MRNCTMALMLVVIALLLAGQCLASEGGLGYKIGYDTEGASLCTRVVVAYMEGASKGFDGESMWSSFPSEGIFFATRKVKGVDDWNGDTGWYDGDIREPLSPGQSISIDGIYLWAAPGTTSQDMHLHLVDRPFLDAGVSYNLTLVSIPEGIDRTGLPTSWGPETTDIVLPFYSSDDGTTGYRFHLDVSAVPEPSSLFAVLSGVAGFGGLMLKRRRAGTP